MNKIFSGPLAGELFGFLQFKRSLGYGYTRAEFTLREFDRFLIEYAARNHHWRLNQAVIAWLSSKPGRKAISVSDDAAVLRQFYRYLRRFSDPRSVVEPRHHQLHRIKTLNDDAFGAAKAGGDGGQTKDSVVKQETPHHFVR